MLPKISIITPSFNQGDYMEQTILSVLNQGYPNLEYIIVDGGSKDHTVALIKKYESRISFWVSEPDKGQTDALNKGFKKATGDIVNWINSDDYYAGQCLFQVADSFRDPKVQAVTTTVRNFEEGGAEWNELTPRCSGNAAYIARAFNNQPGTFFRKEVWDRYFPMPPQLRYTMDQYLWFCYWLENKVEGFKTETYTTVNFRRHALSKTSNSLGDLVFNTLGKVFFNEHNLIFWSYFHWADPLKAAVVAGYFWDNFDYRKNVISFPPHIKFDAVMAEKIFQLYLFQLLKEDYRLGFFDRLRQHIGCLKAEYFSPAEKGQIEKMRFRAARPLVVKAYRNVFWKINNFFK
ncbi:glycosyltransferase family 2 protein [Paraflavisolibacter sp. H34]|uniref:glycosyltransferase family 2 protein n=1 Tax=Huijunlia imazamoxiresistens TaxID=3127457 RepID=UPI003017AEBD